MDCIAELQDIQVLSLYKQHYFDQYDTVMQCRYTCLGYYDGLDITPIDLSQEQSKSGLFEKKSSAAISPVWCGTVHNAESLNGKYGKQDIGVFRCCQKSQEEQWIQNATQYSPYITVAFIQLTSREAYKKAADNIRQISRKGDGCEEYILSVPYFTYDNADLIVFLYSNRIQKIDDALSAIEKEPEVCYLHSIFGISEAYLEDCRKKGAILEVWHENKCFTDDAIAHIMLNIATAGELSTAGKIKTQLSELKSKSPYTLKMYHAFGHENFIVDISNAKVEHLLLMLQPNGPATHQNPLFGKEIYNIETSFCIRELGIKAEPVLKREQKDSILWFSQRIMEYKREMGSIWKEDEGLYSYYCALVQTANTLAQYEGFSLARDIFLLLFPAFAMFDGELKKSVKSIKEHGNSRYDKDMICVKNAIHEFVNAVNSIVYHTVHTDQVFLMIPGSSGTSFSIPVKLCLVYLNIIHNVIDLLNDSSYTYTCLLTPELEIRPATSPITVNSKADDQLIRFTVSQRSLYMPRHFIILLTHEIAHYAGTQIRNRHGRLKCICRTLAHLLAEGVNPESTPNDASVRLLLPYLNNITSMIQQKSVKYIYDKVKGCQEKNKEHSAVMSRHLKEACYELLEERGIIHQLIWSVPLDLYSQNAGYDLAKFAETLNRKQNELDRNRRELFASRGTLDTCIEELVSVYKEIFSDIAAYEILGFDLQAFSETFNVSEGHKTEYDDGKKSYDIQRTVREQVMQERTNENQEIVKNWGNSSTKNGENSSTKNGENSSTKNGDCSVWPGALKEKLFSYRCVGEYLLEYASECAKMIRERWGTQRDLKEKREEIQTIYRLFENQGKSCEEIYDAIVGTISSYDKKITEMYADAVEKEKNK